MRRFASKLIIFLSPILLMLALLEHRLTLVDTGYRTKRVYLERHIDQLQVIITGSSQSYYGIKPRLLGVPVFSIAYVSQDIYYDTRILLKYLTQARNARVVIVPISYFTLEYLLEDSPETWRTSYYYRFWDIPHISPGFNMADHSFIALYGVERTRGFVWRGIPATDPEVMDEGGGLARLGGTNAAAVMDARETLKHHHSLMKREYVTRNRRYLEELLTALSARRISIVIITTPCFRSYSDRMLPDAYGLMQSEIQQLRRHYGLEYRNYLLDSRFTADDFADSDHLSTVGAEKFSRILKDDVVSRYIQ